MPFTVDPVVEQMKDINEKLDRIKYEAMPNGDSRIMTDATIEDRHGHCAEFTFMRDMKVAEPYRLVGVNFMGATIDSNFWVAYTRDSGVFTQTNFKGLLSTGSTSDAHACVLQSVRTARFVFAHPHIYRAAIMMDTVADNNALRRWGAYNITTAASGPTLDETPSNGFYFKHVNGTLYCCVANKGVETAIASGSFNGDISRYTLDTNLRAYEIHYFVMKTEFYIDGILLHTMVPTDDNMTSEYTLPITCSVYNNGSTDAAVKMYVHAAMILRIGREMSQPTSVYQSGTTAANVLKRSAGVLHTLAMSAVSNNSVVTLYDNTAASGRVIWSSGSMGAKTTPFNIDLHEVPFFIGLTLVIATANSNVTVIFE